MPNTEILGLKSFCPGTLKFSVICCSAYLIFIYIFYFGLIL